MPDTGRGQPFLLSVRSPSFLEPHDGATPTPDPRDRPHRLAPGPCDRTHVRRPAPRSALWLAQGSPSRTTATLGNGQHRAQNPAVPAGPKMMPPGLPGPALQRSRKPPGDPQGLSRRAGNHRKGIQRGSASEEGEVRAEPGKRTVWGEPGGTPCPGAGGVRRPPWGRTQHLPNTEHPPTACRPPPSSKAQACQPDSSQGQNSSGSARSRLGCRPPHPDGGLGLGRPGSGPWLCTLTTGPHAGLARSAGERRQLGGLCVSRACAPGLRAQARQIPSQPRRLRQ